MSAPKNSIEVMQQTVSFFHEKGIEPSIDAAKAKDGLFYIEIELDDAENAIGGLLEELREKMGGNFHNISSS